ncbi:MAG: LamG domain-containing protein, partial [Acidobacteria bacterium]|nr:LamG domain-containing protein [Acidobacteriota bacterium]
DVHGSNNLADNNTVTQATGKVGKAALFTAANSEWLSVADNATLDTLTAMTLLVWFKPTDNALARTIAAKWDYATQGGWAFGTDDVSAADELKIHLATSLTDNGTGCNATTTNADLVAGSWHFLALVYDGSLTGDANRLKLYVNNVQKTLTFSGTVPAALQNNTASFKLGDFGGTIHRYLNGALDSVSLYGRALTSTELSTHYASGSGLDYPF